MKMRSIFICTALWAISPTFAQGADLLPVERAFQRIFRVYESELIQRKAQLSFGPEKNQRGTTSAAIWIDFFASGPVARIGYNKTRAADPSFHEDFWSSVLCHELGHLLGGPPYIRNYPGDADDVSTEGQADYFAAAKCLKRIWNNDAENEQVVRSIDPQTVKTIRNQGCLNDQCVRIVNTTYELHLKLDPDAEMAFDKRSSERPSYTRSASEANSEQCRLDTAIAGAICPIDPQIPFGQLSQREGACTADSPDPRARLGARPACWFNPMNLDKYY